ncbi:hypothetical protein V5O48_014014 [Marasmius crinis-equi]|uniref:CxC5 like cysteine cluster associated with KDZ domain-containing protein n=1 Tax=Marasmius crinis-equi TaxID=585013 RepID=A0ABR3EYH2_9AGAR
MEHLTLAQLSALSLPTSLSLFHLNTFIRISRFLRPEILINTKNPGAALVPEALPGHVARFLGACINLPLNNILNMWPVLKEVIWDGPEGKLQEGDQELFEKHGKVDESDDKHLDCTTKTRHYYSSTFADYIHLEQHTYIQRTLCELFTVWMVFAWVSAQNSANIYNHALSGLARDWCVGGESRFILSSEQAWRAFVLHALFCHASEHNIILTMSEAPGVDHDLRLKDAQVHRNDLVARSGLSERLHACGTCEKFISSDLPKAHLGLPPDHMALEDYRNLKGKGFFTLKKRLETANQSPGDGDDDDEIGLNGDPAHKSDLGNTQVKARFGWRRTHNEQLVVCTCGVIAARATMFGAEAISGVKDLLKSIYPDPRELPQVIFYENNCKLQAHLLATQDSYFKKVIMPVDVFHFECKHSSVRLKA